MTDQVEINAQNEPKYFRMMPDKRHELINKLLARHWSKNERKRLKKERKRNEELGS